MYKKRLWIDEDSVLYKHLINLKKEELIALTLKNSQGDSLVVVSQEEYFELKAIEEEFLTSKGLRVKTTPHNSKELSEKIATKMDNLKTKMELHDEVKVQGISVVEGE